MKLDYFESRFPINIRASEEMTALFKLRKEIDFSGNDIRPLDQLTELKSKQIKNMQLKLHFRLDFNE